MRNSISPSESIPNRLLYKDNKKLSNFNDYSTASPRWAKAKFITRSQSLGISLTFYEALKLRRTIIEYTILRKPEQLMANGFAEGIQLVRGKVKLFIDKEVCYGRENITR